MSRKHTQTKKKPTTYGLHTEESYNYRRKPLRGIWKEMAGPAGYATAAGVLQAFKRGDTRVVKLVSAERTRRLRQYRRECDQVARLKVGAGAPR